MGQRDEYASGQAWFKLLSTADKWTLGDQFVLGTFDWRDWDHWLSKPPSRAFLNGAEYERKLWEPGA